MIALSIALVIISSQYFLFRIWQDSERGKAITSIDQSVIDRLNSIEDKVANLQTANSMRGRN